MDRVCVSKDCPVADICKIHSENYKGKWIPSANIDSSNCRQFENKNDKKD